MRRGDMGQDGGDAAAVHAANVADMSKLKNASGSSFDTRTCQRSSKENQTVLSKLNNYSVSNSSLQAIVTSTKETVQHSLDALHNCRRRLCPVREKTNF